MTSEYVMAVDAGTTSVRCMLFAHGGEVVAVSQRPLTQHYPGDGMVEHDALEIWALCRETVRECLSRPGIDPSGCVAMGITNQRETTVVWDRRTGVPLHNAIVWQDRRTFDVCHRLRDDGLGDGILRRTGLQVDAYFSGTKAGWILDNVPGARDMAERGDALFGTVETWLIWNLTGGAVHATDYSNASRTMMFNIHDLSWDPFLLDALGIPEAMLPEPFPPGHVFGTTDPDTIGISVPIASALGDQQAALFGQTCFDDGDVKITFGTGGFLLMNLGREAKVTSNGLLTTVAWGSREDPVYALEGSIYIAGAAIQWLRDDHNGAHPGDEPDAHSPGRPGVHRVPGQRRHRRDEVRLRHGHTLDQGGRRSQRQRLPVPVPGRHNRHGGGAPQMHRVHRPRDRVHGGAHRRVLDRP